MNVTWKLPDGRKISATVETGTSMMQAAVDNNVTDISGECGGCLSCATCHVYVAPEWVAKTGVADEFEDAMLDVAAAERRDSSRLSCQIDASPALDGLILIVPQP